MDILLKQLNDTIYTVNIKRTLTYKFLFYFKLFKLFKYSINIFNLIFFLTMDGTIIISHLYSLPINVTL